MAWHYVVAVVVVVVIWFTNVNMREVFTSGALLRTLSARFGRAHLRRNGMLGDRITRLSKHADVANIDDLANGAICSGNDNSGNDGRGCLGSNATI